MAKFFGKKTSIGKLEIEESSMSADSPEMLKRLDRISDNYEKLDSILSDLEFKIAEDERLKEEKKKKAELAKLAAETEAGSPESPPSANPGKPR